MWHILALNIEASLSGNLRWKLAAYGKLLLNLKFLGMCLLPNAICFWEIFSSKFLRSEDITSLDHVWIQGSMFFITQTLNTWEFLIWFIPIQFNSCLSLESSHKSVLRADGMQVVSVLKHGTRCLHLQKKKLCMLP